VRRSSAACAVGFQSPGSTGFSARYFTAPSVMFLCAPMRSFWPSKVHSTAVLPSQSRSVLVRIASNTGFTSVGDLLVTSRMSLVAVCCSSDCCSSRVRSSTFLSRPA
jgi:hypothetical protein